MPMRELLLQLLLLLLLLLLLQRFEQEKGLRCQNMVVVMVMDSLHKRKTTNHRHPSNHPNVYHPTNC